MQQRLFFFRQTNMAEEPFIPMDAYETNRLLFSVRRLEKDVDYGVADRRAVLPDGEFIAVRPHGDGVEIIGHR